MLNMAKREKYFEGELYICDSYRSWEKGKVTVRQNASNIMFPQDDEMNPPIISWKSPGAVPIEDAVKFQVDLALAIQIASEWRYDTRRKAQNVLKIDN